MLAFRHSYENPLLTATSRNVITDIYHAAQQWTEVDMPRPLMLLSRVFGRKTAPRDPWFPVLRIWSEVGDICDAESFGASRACVCVCLVAEHCIRRWAPSEHRRTHHTRPSAPGATRRRGRATTRADSGRRMRERFLAGRGIRALVQSPALSAYISACPRTARDTRRLAEPITHAAARALAPRVQR